MTAPQHSILEADQEENEEGAMNDEDINEIISRSEVEAELFKFMDIRREREVAEAWRAQGNRGKPPPGLMAVEELPDCYRTDSPFEDGEDTGKFAERTREISRAGNGLQDAEGTPAPELNGRGRQGKKGKAKTPDFGFDISLGVKRKRGAAAKAMSITPSVQKDGDEYRESVRPPFVL